MTSLVSNNTETEIVVLKAWWERNCKPFSEWFLGLDEAAKVAVLKKGCHDMPAVSSATRSKEGAELKATDVLLPELSQDALLARGGQIAVLFITRRLMDKSLCFASDAKLLNSLYKLGKLPAFGKSLAHLDTPFVDPKDPEENVQVLSKDTSDAVREKVMECFDDCTLIRCEVLMSLKIRRTAIASFLVTLFEEFESEAEQMWVPKPSYQQLLAGELAQQKLVKEMQEKADVEHHLEALGTDQDGLPLTPQAAFKSTSGLEDVST